jgi:hypothetical protein
LLEESKEDVVEEKVVEVEAVQEEEDSELVKKVLQDIANFNRYQSLLQERD